MDEETRVALDSGAANALIASIRRNESMIRLATAFVAATFTLAASAHAEQTRIYGPDGRSLGTVSRDSAGSARYYGPDGRSRGTSSTSSDGTTTYYDAQGRVIGRSTRTK